MSITIEPVARIASDLKTKFGAPRQSGRVPALKADILFTPAYRDANAVRGLSRFSHLWLIWGFSLIKNEGWSPTVRPPRLGGNVRMGVFATRSPFRPNRLGLSHVKLDGVEFTPEGPVLHVSGADLVDGTPIYDIKPYLPSDAVHDASAGFTLQADNPTLNVFLPEKPAALLSPSQREALVGILGEDPRPGYADDARRYGFFFAEYEVFFHVENGAAYVEEIVPRRD